MYDGRAWFIPETSLSAPSDPESRNAIPVNPGTCSNGHQNLNQVDTNVPKPSHRKEETTTSDGDNFPEDKEFSSKEENHSVERNQSSPSSGENFPEDNSISTQKKSTSDGSIPYLGTQAHPIEPSSSPSDGKISTEVITGGTTDIINVTDSSSTATEEEFTLVSSHIHTSEKESTSFDIFSNKKCDRRLINNAIQYLWVSRNTLPECSR